MKNFVVIFLVVVMIPFAAISQTLTIGTVVGSVPGTPVLVPVYANNFNNGSLFVPLAVLLFIIQQ